MPRFVSVSSFVLLIAFVFAGPVLADDWNEPPWTREDPGTTYARWEFDGPGVAIPGSAYPFGYYGAPDDWYGPYPDDPPTLQVFGSGRDWMSQYPEVSVEPDVVRFGVWPLSGIIVIRIPNYPPENPEKRIRVQLTWASDSPFGKPSVEVQPEGNAAAAEIVPLEISQLAGGPWTNSLYTTTIYPNPPWERIVIQGNVYVDEVVVDTWCVPEPGGVLGIITGSLGLVGFVSRRRTRR